jgi:hypothetical protein
MQKGFLSPFETIKALQVYCLNEITKFEQTLVLLKFYFTGNNFLFLE